MAKVAVIETGGKQYVVMNDSVITVEKIPGNVGDNVAFDKVLLVDDGSGAKVGSPYISGAKVTGVVADAGRDDKVTVIHYRQKSRYFKKRGHRQSFSKIKITALP